MNTSRYQKVIFLGNFLKKFQSHFMYVFKGGTRCLIKFQSSYLIILLDFLDYQTLVSLWNYWGSEAEYIQNFQCLLHFLLSRIYVTLVNNKIDYLWIIIY